MSSVPGPQPDEGRKTALLQELEQLSQDEELESLPGSHQGSGAATRGPGRPERRARMSIWEEIDRQYYGRRERPWTEQERVTGYRRT